MKSNPDLIITSTQNPAVIRFSKLKDDKYRRSEGLFLCEGKKLAEEALAASAVKYVLCRNDMASEYFSLLEEAGRSSAQIMFLADAPFGKVSTEKSPQGIIAVCSCFSHKPNRNDFGPAVMCCGVRDPGNLGAIIRTAAGLGFEDVILFNCADIYNPRTVRASMGTLFKCRIDLIDDPFETIMLLRSTGRRVFATALEERSLVFGDFELHPSDVFVIGNEGHGLDPELIEKCSDTVCISLKNAVESFNAAIAAGIILWEQSKTMD